jgi:hypothetical protein
MAKEKKIVEFSPKGVARYPWLNKPKTQFKAAGEYVVDLILPGQDPKTLALIEQINGWTEQAFNAFYSAASAKNKKIMKKGFPYSEEYNKQDELTGNMVFKFGCGTGYEDKKTHEMKEMRPGIFDIHGTKLDPAENMVWGGSIIRVQFSPGPMKDGVMGYVVASTQQVGVKLYLNNVQVIKFVQGQDSNPFGDASEDYPDDDDFPTEKPAADSDDDDDIPF